MVLQALFGGKKFAHGTDEKSRSKAVGAKGMYIAMNRFKIEKGSESAFEDVWASRETHLDQVPGYKEFHLVRGPEHEDYTLYASHTLWNSEADFVSWTKSEAFRLAHKNAGENKKLYLGHPEFEGFTIVL